MESTLTLHVISPLKQIPPVQASEVVLPGVDGEVGFLPGHENRIGLLGTGPLKYVSNSNDYWVVVSSGSYQVIDGKLTVLTEVVEEAAEIDAETVRAEATRLDTLLNSADMTTPEFSKNETELKRHRARLDVHRRVSEVN